MAVHLSPGRGLLSLLYTLLNLEYIINPSLHTYIRLEIFAMHGPRTYFAAFYLPRATNVTRFPPIMLNVLYLTSFRKIQWNVQSLQE